MPKWVTLKLTPNQSKALQTAAELGIFERLAYGNPSVKRYAMKALERLKLAIKKDA